MGIQVKNIMAETFDNDRRGYIQFYFSNVDLYSCFVCLGETYLPTANVKYGIVTDTVGYAIGLRNGDKILTVDNQRVENFHEISSYIILNHRKTIQVERDGKVINIEIPKEYIPKMLKGKGQIDTRIPFGPYVIESFGKKSPAKTAGVLLNDQITGIDDKKFTYYDEFQKYLFDNKEHPVILNLLA